MQKLYVGIGAILIVIGLVLGPAVAMVTLTADNTPPVWGTDSNGYIALAPKNGDSWSSLTQILAEVNDPESGVSSVSAQIDGHTYVLVVLVGTPKGAVWTYKGTLPTLATGSHTISYTATNGVGLTTTYTGTFTIYNSLAGNWFINGVQITNSSQTVYSKTLLIAFEFDKTAGAADSAVTCTVTEGSNLLVTLTNSAAGKWTGTYTFTAGTHSLTLKASDGVSYVSMSLFNFTAGASTWSLPKLPVNIVPSVQWTLGVLGFVFVGYGTLTGHKNPKNRRFK